MRQHAAKRNRRTDERVELLVAANRQLEVTRGDALDVEILGRVAGQLEHLGRQVLEHGGEVDGRLGADAGLVTGDVAEVTFYAAAGELSIRLLEMYVVG